MKADNFRSIALKMQHAVEGAHMGHPDFRANGRIFATIHTNHKTGMVKLTPEQQRTIMADHPEAFSLESGAWGRQGCTRVNLDSVDEETLGAAMTLAWQNTASKTTASSKAKRKPKSRK